MRAAPVVLTLAVTACASIPSWAPTLTNGVLDALSCGSPLVESKLAGSEPDASDYIDASACWLRHTASSLESTAPGPEPSVEHGEAVVEAAEAQRDYEARPNRWRARRLTEAVERCEAASGQ